MFLVYSYYVEHLYFSYFRFFHSIISPKRNKNLIEICKGILQNRTRILPERIRFLFKVPRLLFNSLSCKNVGSNVYEQRVLVLD